MQRKKADVTRKSSSADLAWTTMDLLFWPLRESAKYTRRLLRDIEHGRGSDDGTTASGSNAASENRARHPGGADDPARPVDGRAPDETPANSASLEDVWGVGAARAPKLRAQGLSSLQEVAEADVETLTALPGVGAETAERIRESAAALADQG